MAVQTNLFPDPPAPPPPPPPPDSSGVMPVWFQRLWVISFVVFCVYLGLFLLFLPWKPSLWDHNLFFVAHPRLWTLLRLGPVRGIVSGLGALDIWIGISEAIHYRDYRDYRDNRNYRAPSAPPQDPPA